MYREFVAARRRSAHEEVDDRGCDTPDLVTSTGEAIVVTWTQDPVTWWRRVRRSLIVGYALIAVALATAILTIWKLVDRRSRVPDWIALFVPALGLAAYWYLQAIRDARKKRRDYAAKLQRLTDRPSPGRTP